MSALRILSWARLPIRAKHHLTGLRTIVEYEILGQLLAQSRLGLSRKDALRAGLSAKRMMTSRFVCPSKFEHNASARKDNVMTSFRIGRPDGRDIHVVRGPNQSWLVKQGEKRLSAPSYRICAHAMAFARAAAHGSHADMIVHETGGRETRYVRASLSYPRSLD